MAGYGKAHVNLYEIAQVEQIRDDEEFHGEERNMKVVGVDFDASKALFVVVEGGEDGQLAIVETRRLQLDDTRSAGAMKAVRDEIRDFLSAQSADAISIRAKPENGQMRAGAAALKMEAIVMAESGSADLSFVSSVKAGKLPDAPGLFAYFQTAYKAAAARLAYNPARKKGGG